MKESNKRFKNKTNYRKCHGSIIDGTSPLIKFRTVNVSRKRPELVVPAFYYSLQG